MGPHALVETQRQHQADRVLGGQVAGGDGPDSVFVLAAFGFGRLDDLAGHFRIAVGKGLARLGEEFGDDRGRTREVILVDLPVGVLRHHPDDLVEVLDVVPDTFGVLDHVHEDQSRGNFGAFPPHRQMRYDAAPDRPFQLVDPDVAIVELFLLVGVGVAPDDDPEGVVEHLGAQIEHLHDHVDQFVAPVVFPEKVEN